MNRMHGWVLNTRRYYKRAALVCIDLVLLGFTLWAALSLRFGELYVPPTLTALALVIAAPLICIATLWCLDVYRLVTRFMGYRDAVQVSMGIGLATLIWSLVVFMSGQGGIPRSVIILFGLSGALVLTLARYAIKLLLDGANVRVVRPQVSGTPKLAVIYGAGQMGVRLLADVRKARDRKIVGFIDSSPTLWRQYIAGLKVFAPDRLPRLIKMHGALEVLVALPGSQRHERRAVLKELEALPVSVKVLPAYEDIASGNIGVTSLREVDVGDLLGRDPVAPIETLMSRNIRGRAILITGAGGSIGSELARQAVGQSPRIIVLFDVSEPALYKIVLELREMCAQCAPDARPVVKSVLGSVLDRGLVANTIEANEIETIYHAAAYKHVPIVEENPIVGLDNNLFGTLAVTEAARDHGVERFVLISTDKAVRPTNMMGASKRLAELVVQAEAASGNGKTVSSVVRFGNVLDSSGSVVPLFREQIRKGGPVTVTHPEATRYFMSIPEAAELVIQAGAMAAGGEVFVLQMGEPVLIDKLARLMIRLSNLEVRAADNPDGDVEISYIGLRPGEKLNEELLVSADMQESEHPRIFKSDEPFLPASRLNREIGKLRDAMAARDNCAIHAILTRTVEDYRPASLSEAPPEANIESAASRPVPFPTNRGRLANGVVF